MANDRIFLVCKQCKAEKLLYKYFPGGGSLWKADDIEEFMDKHVACDEGEDAGRGRGRDLGGDPGFTLKTES